MNPVNTAPDPQPTYQAKIIEWDPDKGYGFLLHRKRKVFLHRKEFSERHKRPATGDKIHFHYGQDKNGRQCATNARHVNDGGKLTLTVLLITILLLAVPALATYAIIARTGIHYALPLSYLAIINLATYSLYRADKARARKQHRRIPEATLHLFELLGGWPAAFIAQRQIRHKSSKILYQLKFWPIIMIHLYTAADYIMRWKITHWLISQINNI